MWIRQCELDANNDERLPIPTRIASNEEFIPPEQTPEQREVEMKAWALAETAAARVGLSRRDFLRGTGGMVAALLALNEVFGKFYEADAEELVEPAKSAEKWPKDEFIFDIQTHHVDISRNWYEDTPEGKRIKTFFRLLRPQGKTIDDSLELLNRDHYIKEMFLDSDTVMAVISGVPSRTWEKNPLPPDQMAATRDYVNKIANSERVLSHGLLRPNMGPSELDEMQRQVENLGIRAWKMYTGTDFGEDAPAWWLDDEKVSYPFWEKSKKLGIKNLCVHKGLPLGFFNEAHCKPKDLEKAAKDWPDLNFIVYHSGFRGFGPVSRGLGKPVVDPKSDDPQEIPWISDIFRILKRNPDIKNIYFELGSTFGQTSAFRPQVCAHMLGQMLQTAGPERIIWGTDCIWSGSPQSQIERFRRFAINSELREKFGYPELTKEIKAKIFGLNCAKLFGLDPAAKRQAIDNDKLTQIRRDYLKNPWPSNTQYGWVWAPEKDRDPTLPVGSNG